MKKERMLVWVIVVLALLNFGTLGFLLLHKPPKPPGLRPEQLDRLIVGKLSLDPAQQQAFEGLKSAHHEQITQLDNAFRTSLGSYFSLLEQDVVSSSEKDSLEARLLAVQQQRSAVTFQHFAELKALAGPAQRDNFKTLLPELMQVILPPPKQSPRPGSKNEGK